MATNITSSVITNAKVELLDNMILSALDYELSIFAPGFFSPAGLPAPEYKVPVYDVTPQIKKGARKGDTVTILEFGKLVAKDKIPDTPVVNQTQSIAKRQLTINKHKYVSLLFEDAAEIFANHMNMERFAKEQAKAIAHAFECDILALADGFSQSIGSGNGTVINYDTFGEVNRTFFNAGIDISRPGNEAYAIVTPYVWEDLCASRDEYQLAGDMGVKSFNSGKILETPHGVRVVRSNNYTAASGAVKQMVITKEAIMVGFGIMPRTQRERAWER